MNDPASPSHPPRIFLRWIIRIGIALILLAALLILAAPMLVNSLVRPKVLVAINDGLLGEASIGNLRFSWLDGVTVEDLRISNPPGFAKEDAVSIGRVHVNPSLTSLMSGRLFLKDDLRIENVRLNVEQNAAGDLNLARLVKEQPARTSKPAGIPASDPRAATASNTTTVQGGVVLDDLVLSLKTPTLTAPAVMAPLHAEARVQGLDRPVTFAVRNSDQSLSVRGDASFGARLLANLDYAITPAFLAPLKTALASLGPVKKFDGDLSGKGHLTLGDANTSSGKGDLTFAINSLSLESTDDQGQKKLYDLHPGDTVLNFEFKPAEGKSDFVLNAKAPATGLSFKGQTDGAGFEGALRLGTDLSELSRRLPGIIPVEAGLRRKVDVSLPRLKADAKTATAELDVHVENLASGQVKPIKDFDAKLQFRADLQKQAFALETSLDLSRLRDIAVSLGAITPATELTGSVKAAAEARMQGADLLYRITIDGAKFHFKGPQPSGIVIDEPQPAIRLTGTVQPDKTGAVLRLDDGSSVNTEMLRAGIKGTIRQAAGQGVLAEGVIINATYEPSKLNPLLASFSAGKIVATGPQQTQIRLDGPLQPGNDFARWLQFFKSENQLGFTSYDYAGINIEGGPLNANLDDGVMPINYTCQINRGPFSAKGNVRLTGPESDLSIKLDDMNINAEMSSWLGTLNPLMGSGKAAKPSLSGQASAQFSGRWRGALMETPGGKKGEAPDYLKLASSRLSGKGSFSVASFKVSGSPLLLALNALAGNLGDSIGEIQPSEFTIERGALRYGSMVVILGGQKFVFAGAIGFNQRMEMQITMPFPARLIKDPRLAKYLNTITIPLTGTVSEPKLDAQGVIQIALQKATGEALKDGVGGILDKKTGGGVGNILKGVIGGKK